MTTFGYNNYSYYLCYMLILKKKIPIYFGELVVIFNDDFQESLKPYKIEYDTAGCDGLFLLIGNNKKSHFTILLESKPKHAVIAHEVVHCTHRLLDGVRHEATFVYDEPEAYLHGWIIKEIYDFIKKNNIEVI